MTPTVSFAQARAEGSERTELTALLKSFAMNNIGPKQKFKTGAALTQISAGIYPGQPDWHILSSLKSEHPRLIISSGDIATISDTIESDPEALKLFEVLKKRAEEMLVSESPKYDTSDEGALKESRLALKHLTTFSAMYRLTHDTRFAKQARDEMLKIAAFPDWGRANFLDVAEMTASMAIGYDWLFDQLSAEERQTIRDAIVARGLEPGLAQYHGDGWWRLANSNWNFVCNGGLTMGALAVAESEPVKAERIVACALVSSPMAFNFFEPDGGWSEGPMYWTYGTRYATYFLASLQSALGTDFGFSDSKGLEDTGYFRIYSESPIGKCFNFADSETEVGRGAQMFWLSRKFNRPEFAGAELHIADIFPEMFHLLFYTSSHRTPYQSKLPLNKLFKGVNVVCLRSSWTDPKAAYTGFKGGDNASHHAHLDLGTFVFDCNGVRWAEDLGPEDYAVPGYFSEKRWSYYRTRTEGHNTLTIGLDNQNLKAKAAIVKFSAKTPRPFAIADLTEAYKGHVTTAKRGVKLLGRNGMLVQDEIDAPNVVHATWHLHTPAQVHLTHEARVAVLTQTGVNGTATVFAKILAPEWAVFSQQSLRLDAPQKPESDSTDLTIPLNLPFGKTTIVVEISREPINETAIKALQHW